MSYRVQRQCFACLLLILCSQPLQADCKARIINPFTDIAWHCIFPISLGGVVQLGSGDRAMEDKIESPVCTCKNGPIPRIGLKVSFWEPSRIIDTTATPYCIMPLGTQLKGPRKPGSLGGGLVNDATANGKAFQQMHYYLFPVWKLLNLFVDIPCLRDEGFDVLMMTELYPPWQNEMTGLLVNPEAVLFSNPATQLACMADSVASLKRPVNALFWCMGSWGNAYPLSGSITSTDYVEANAGLAARGIFLMGRLGMLWSTTPDGCAITLTPIWKKDRHKLQLMQPRKDSTCLNIGRSGQLWTHRKHPLRRDNFSWLMFKKIDCCISY